MPLAYALGMEAFISIHMTVFVFIPLSKLLGKDEDSSKRIVKMLFIGRVLLLLYFDFFITPSIAIFDFFSMFIGAFLIVPILSNFKKNKYNLQTGASIVNQDAVQTSRTNLIVKCVNCGQEVDLKHKFCLKCGKSLAGDNLKVEEAIKTNSIVPDVKYVKLGQYDPMYQLSEDGMLEEFINREIKKAQIDLNTKLIPSAALKRKKVIKSIFSLLVAVFICSIFFHFPISFYVGGLIILFIFYKLFNNYNFMKYLKKEIKSRPNEKISNIVMNVKLSLVTDNSSKLFICSLLLAIIVPLIIFINPVILYEKVDGGYAVRYYLFGLTNFKTATIPAQYKGEDVVSLRGNTFSNMPFLTEVTLPDTLLEIRGQAFKNDINLVKVNIPNKLEYLGGGAFYNCRSIETIELPDTLTELGGESFYNAKSLKSIKLSNNLTEIRGNTFEKCSSLKSIEIPDKVERIGGSAFREAYSLETVIISKNSNLKEIGSSAFRGCNSLDSITLPKGVSLNERTFKESPTVVKYYGEFSSLGSNYSYTNIMTLDLGDTVNINFDYDSNTIQHATLKFDEYKTTDLGKPVYYFIYKVENEQPNYFILSEENKTKLFGADIAFELKMLNSGNSSVEIYVYTN